MQGAARAGPDSHLHVSVRVRGRIVRRGRALEGREAGKEFCKFCERAGRVVFADAAATRSEVAWFMNEVAWLSRC